LLRLLLPLNNKIWTNSQIKIEVLSANNSDSVLSPHRIIQSVEATGGVYKGRGRNRCRLMTYAY